MSAIFYTRRVLVPLGLIIALSAAAFADTLRLKDGGIIKGRIVSFSGGRFTVSVGEGQRARQMSFDASEVESIQFDPPSAAVKPSVVISDPAVETEKDPQYIQTSTPPKSIPRVVTTDTTTRKETANVRPTP